MLRTHPTTRADWRQGIEMIGEVAGGAPPFTITIVQRDRVLPPEVQAELDAIVAEGDTKALRG